MTTIKNTIIKTNEFQIIEEERNGYYTIKLKESNVSLLLSLIKSGILLGATISDGYQSITFRANKVENYQTHKKQEQKQKQEQNKKYEKAMKLLYDFGRQIKYLITKENKCFYRLNPENLIIIDETKYIYLSTSDLVDIQEEEREEQENNNVTIYAPFTKNLFDSPEINRIIQIPAKVDYKSIYYSLAKLIIFFLFDQEKEKEKEETIMNHLNHLNKIKGTKLFYTLERCLQTDPDERSLLFI